MTILSRKWHTQQCAENSTTTKKVLVLPTPTEVQKTIEFSASHQKDVQTAQTILFSQNSESKSFPFTKFLFLPNWLPLFLTLNITFFWFLYFWHEMPNVLNFGIFFLILPPTDHIFPSAIPLKTQNENDFALQYIPLCFEVRLHDRWKQEHRRNEYFTRLFQ